MPTRKKTRSKGQPSAVDPEPIVRRALETLERDAVVKITALGPPRGRAEVVNRLRAAGYEVTARVVRRAIAEQLRALLADGAFIPMKRVATFVSGATAAEAKQAALRLVASGDAHVVVRTKVETLVPASVPVVPRARLKTVAAALGILQKQVAPLTRATAKATLLVEDLAALLEPLIEQLQQPKPRGASAAATTSAAVNRAEKVNAPAAHDEDGLGILLRAIDAARDERMGMSFIPRVLSELVPELELEAAQSALLSAAEQGVVELRPEGGLGRLSREDLELCPPGPGGTRLSWARRVAEEGS